MGALETLIGIGNAMLQRCGGEKRIPLPSVRRAKRE
jgi:hypothetical protein